jgi:hypothetical protein
MNVWQRLADGWGRLGNWVWKTSMLNGGTASARQVCHSCSGPFSPTCHNPDIRWKGVVVLREYIRMDMAALDSKEPVVGSIRVQHSKLAADSNTLEEVRNRPAVDRIQRMRRLHSTNRRHASPSHRRHASPRHHRAIEPERRRRATQWRQPERQRPV